MVKTMSFSRRRIDREIENLNHFKADYYSATMRQDNNYIWDITITTDKDSAYGVYKHKMEFHFPQNYPFAPPKVRLASPINYHCASRNGILDLDILSSTWSPAYAIGGLIVAIASFLNESDMDNLRSRQICRTGMFKDELIAAIYNPERFMTHSMNYLLT